MRVLIIGHSLGLSLAERRPVCTRTCGCWAGATMASEGEDHVKSQACLGCKRNSLRLEGQSGDGALCHGLSRLQWYGYGENRADARGYLAMTPSDHEASDVTLADRHLVSSPVRNSREIQVMRA